MGLLDRALAEGLAFDRLGITDDLGDESHDALDDHEGCGLAAGDHVVAEGDLLVDHVLGDPLVDTLVPATDERKMAEPGPSVEMILTKRSAARREQHSVGSLDGVERLGQRLRHEHHPGAATERAVVHLAMRSLSPRAQVDRFDVDQAPLDGASGDSKAQRGIEVFGEDRDDRDLHQRSAYCQGVQEHDSESFDLPDWGTEGAPPPPPPDTDLDDAVEPADLFLDVTPELIRTTTQLPSGYRVRNVIGLASAEGIATVTDDVTFAAALAMAKAAALDRLSSEASTSGATAVVGIRLTVATRLNDVVVIAYGTALDAKQV